MKKLATVLSVAISIILLFIPVTSLFLLAILGNLKTSFLIPVAAIVLIVLIGFVAFSISNKKFFKKSIISLGTLILVSLGIIFFEMFYKFNYIPSITFNQHTSYYGKYIPFSDNNNLTNLDEEASLKFSKDDSLPIVDGATALFPIYGSFVQTVYPQIEDIEKYIKFSTTIGAYENLIKGESDIIFVAQPSSQQIEMAKAAGVELNLYPIGYEAFIFVVNSKNPVSDLTLQQVKDIYTGRTTNWKELGGKNLIIRPFQRDANSGSQTAFLKVMGDEPNLLPAETHEVQGMDGLINVVSDYENHKNAIGYSFRYFVQNMNKDIDIKVLSLNGVAPTKETIRNKTYPITDNFYAITVDGRETPETKEFINWIISEQGQKLIEDVGYVSLQ